MIAERFSATVAAIVLKQRPVGRRSIDRHNGSGFTAVVNQLSSQQERARRGSNVARSPPIEGDDNIVKCGQEMRRLQPQDG